MSYKQADNTGSLFVDKDRKSPKHPTHTGSFFLDGCKYQISAWENTSKSGQKYLSLKINPIANSTTADFPPSEEVF